jgi:signal transduction histidine kinase
VAISGVKAQPYSMTVQTETFRNGSGAEAPDNARGMRDATDESLQAERDKTDRELAAKRDAIEEKADDVVDRARTAADKVLETAREMADDKRGSRAVGLVREERTRADTLIGVERTMADECLRKEREQRKSALANLLRLEREDTDMQLLTERGHADEALNTRDIFLAMVSHDLRQMLGGIAMSAAMLARDAPAEVDAPTSVRARAALIQRFTARMNRLVCDLVDVASIEAGKLVVEAKPDDLSSLVHESVELFLPSARERGLSLEMPADDQPVIAPFDRERIVQVLANLISNAIKFTPQGGRVDLRVEQSGTEAHVSVADDGIGVPPDSLATIFGRFCQVGTRNRTGLGLGLFISRCVVEAHGGKIWAENIATGGSRFVFTLPVPPDAEQVGR